MKRNGTEDASAQLRALLGPLPERMHAAVEEFSAKYPDRADAVVQAFLSGIPQSWVVAVLGSGFAKLTAREVLARLEVHDG